MTGPSSERTADADVREVVRAYGGICHTEAGVRGVCFHGGIGCDALHLTRTVAALVARNQQLQEALGWVPALARLDCICERMERMDRVAGRRCFPCEARGYLDALASVRARSET